MSLVHDYEVRLNGGLEKTKRLVLTVPVDGKKKKGPFEIPSHRSTGIAMQGTLKHACLPRRNHLPHLSVIGLSHRSSFGEHVSRNVGTLENDAGTQGENVAPKKHPSRICL